MSDSVPPHRWQPTRLPGPWDSPGKNTGVGCHFLLQCMKVTSEREVAQSCQTLRDPMDCSPPGSSVNGIFQARVLEWVAIDFSIVQLGQDKPQCFDFIFQYMRMRIEPMLKDYCKDKGNHNWLKESIQASFVVIIISVMNIYLLSISLSRLSASGRQNSWHVYFGVTTG